jgi:hypothetical protein
MSLTRREEQTFRSLITEACEGDPRFASRVGGQRWRRVRVRRMAVSLVCFAAACVVLGADSSVGAWVAGGLLFTLGAGLLLRPVLAGRLPCLPWRRAGRAASAPFRWVVALPRRLPRLHRRPS